MKELVEIITRCQNGDPNAFEALFQEYKGLVFKNAILMIGNREAAEEVLQDVFMAVWDSLGKFNPKRAKFTTWLHRITVNRCIDNHRKEQAPTLSFDDEMANMPNVNNSDLPEEALINKLEYERLMRAISRLDIKHRPALVFRYFNDLSYKDIADILDIPLGTVKSRIHNALCMLRKQISLDVLDCTIQER